MGLILVVQSLAVACSEEAKGYRMHALAGDLRLIHT